MILWYNLGVVLKPSGIDMKNFGMGVLILLIFGVLLPFCIIGSWSLWAYNTASGVVTRQVNPNAIVSNYEWYEQQVRDIKAAEGQIKDAEAAAARFKADSGPSDKWAFDQRNEYARLNDNVTGLRQFRRQMIQDYNARASMISRNMWKSGNLPHNIEE